MWLRSNSTALDRARHRHGYPSAFSERLGRRATPAEFKEHFGDLATDDEP
jgi:hypothetical protein